ncbi:hypothetical protein GM51_8935 [freshwater metagenome]|jgi:UPF0755 protein|uniref:Peptidoglycan polymerization terminase n=1 Tax=freshwater metagenome TaxID=449393 RepID=A0A094QV03_9ZZZZ
MRLHRRIFLITGLCALLLFGFLRLQPNNDFSPNNPGSEIVFLVQDGELGSSIAQNLENQGVVKSATKFIEEFNRDPKASGISPGSHSIQTQIPARTAIEQLLDPKRMKSALVVREGSTFASVLSLLKKNENIDRTKTGYGSVKPVYANSRNSLEGSLFPARYSFEANTSVEKALKTMVAKAKSEYTRLGVDAGFDKYKPFEVLTIASMVQIEGDPSNFSKVARVIYNRLKIGMALQLNATVQYATNSQGQIMLSNKATKINSPYNTYRFAGLPPTPIANPSNDAIEATLNPAIGDWLYFITVAPKDTRFTKDFTEFSEWNTEFNKNVAAGKFK